MLLTQINLVVSALEASHRFYTGLGWAMRPITMPDDPEPRAWSTTAGPAPVTIHSQAFAEWWDPSGAHVGPGSATLDLTCEHSEELARMLGQVEELGGTVIAPPRSMPWGQEYAIIGDPDGYRWGLKAAAE